MTTTPIRYTLLTFKIVLIVLWLSASVGAAYAAVTISKAGVSIVVDPTVTVLCCILSTLSGATALFVKVNNILLAQEEARAIGEEPRRFVAPWFFAIAHMLGSWTAGALAFLVSQAAEWSIWYQLVGVVIASFGGAAVLEKAVDRYLSVMPLGPQGGKKP